MQRKKNHDYQAWRATLEQEAINETLQQLSKQGKMSARLKQRLNTATPRPTGHPDPAYGVTLW